MINNVIAAILNNPVAGYALLYAVLILFLALRMAWQASRR